jgi:23S rRNA U2552 (ribose-2'-O)-methylase RlmE/FtsJ
MLIYLLPKVNKNIYKHIQIQHTEDKPPPFVSQSLSFYLNDAKSQINGQESAWDIFKKYTNTFEYIHSIIPNKKTGVSKYRPISRSYFKMVELIDEFHFNLCTPTAIQTFHLAEGPGGFIEAVVNYRKHKKQTDNDDLYAKKNEVDKPDIYIGMTLLKATDDFIAQGQGGAKTGNESPPNWKKIQYFLKENDNIVIEKGVDKTGNILSLNNLIKINEMYGNSIDFITADGGVDFSADFSNQEVSITQLIYGQIVFALCIQKQGGSFVLKIFDCFMKSTVELLVLLSSVYDNVYITKPHTSRSANSEKYIVCKGFNHSSVQLYPYLFFSFKEMLESKNKGLFVNGFLSKPIPQFFLQKVEKYNIMLGEKQLENIHQTLDLINKNGRMVLLKKQLASNSNQANWRKTVRNIEHPLMSEQERRLKSSMEDCYFQTNNSDVFIEKLKPYSSCSYSDIVSWKRKTCRNSVAGNNSEHHQTKNVDEGDEKKRGVNKQVFQTEIDTLVNSNIIKCFHWCIKHNVATI